MLAEEIRAVRASGTGLFGVNLFAPSPCPVDAEAYRAYRCSLLDEAARRGVELPLHPVEDDDHWEAKLALLLEDPVPVVSFTFGLPSQAGIRALRRAGSYTLQTVTSLEEAKAAQEAGVDALVLQGPDAGGHAGTLDPFRIPAAVKLPALVRAVAAEIQLPIIAAGGISCGRAAGAALAAGAAAVAVGTAVLRSPESGATQIHKDALAEPGFDAAVLTRAFTGRYARGLPNRFLSEHSAEAPAGYPALHHLTKPIRAAAAASGDNSAMNLWAGTGFREARALPLARLLSDLEP